MGVDNIFTFDAHDPRVQNAIPLYGFDSFNPPYQFMKALLRAEPNLSVDPDHLMIISRMKVQCPVPYTSPTLSELTWVCSTRDVIIQQS